MVAAARLGFSNGEHVSRSGGKKKGEKEERKKMLKYVALQCQVGCLYDRCTDTVLQRKGQTWLRVTVQAAGWCVYVQPGL